MVPPPIGFNVHMSKTTKAVKSNFLKTIPFNTSTNCVKISEIGYNGYVENY